MWPALVCVCGFPLMRSLPIPFVAAIALFSIGAAHAVSDAAANRILSTPPTKEMLASPQAAKARIAEIDEIIKSTPTRQVEFEAYKIPLQRVVDSAAAGSPAAKAEAEAQRRYLIIVRAREGVMLLRVVNARQQGEAIVVEDVAGRRSVWDRKSVVAAMSWPTDEEIAKLSPEQVTKLVARYQTHASLNKPVQAELLAEAERIEKTAAAASTQPTVDEPDQLQAFLSRGFAPSPTMQPQELAQQLLVAEELRKAHPEAVEQIDSVAVPMREALEKLWSGKVFDGTEWIDGREAKKFATAEELRTAREELQKSYRAVLNGGALTNGGVWSTLQWAFGIYALAVLVGTICLLSRGGMWRVLGVLIVLGALGWGYFRFKPLFEPAPAMAEAPGGGNADAAMEIVLNSAEAELGAPPREESKRVRVVNEADINAFIEERVTFSDPSPEHVVTRKDLQVALEANRVIVEELLEWEGRTFLVRYDFPAEPRVNDLVLKDPAVTINGVAISSRAARPLVESLGEAVGAAMKDAYVRATYRLTRVDPGALELTAMAKPLPSPTPAPTPKPTPTPRPTPEPTPTPKEQNIYEMLGLETPPGEE